MPLAVSSISGTFGQSLNLVLAMSSKDSWDKTEILGKTAGAIGIPVVVAALALFIDNRISERDREAELTNLAVGILSAKPEHDSYTEEDKALRSMAISILDDTLGSQHFNRDIKDVLQETALPIGYSWGFGSPDGGGAGESLPIRWRNLQEEPWIRDECVGRTHDPYMIGYNDCRKLFPDLVED